MEQRTARRLELLVENQQDIKGEFFWQSSILQRLAALLYAAENRRIDSSAVRECYELIKSRTGVFSSFRGNTTMTLATLLSLRSNPSLLLDRVLSVYKLLKQTSFWSSDYLVIAAYQIAAGSSEDQHERIAEKTRAFYEAMKREHFFLTGQDDTIFAAMLGLSDIEIPAGTAHMERLFAALRPHFFSGNGLQALTQVLLLGGEVPGMEERVLVLRDALREQGARLDRAETLSSLGVLALLPGDAGQIAREVAVTAENLRAQRGFGFWSSVSNRERLLLAASLVALDSIDRIKEGTLQSVLSTSVLNIVIAQQAAMIAAASASAAAAAAASSH